MSENLKVYFLSSGCLIHTVVGYLVKRTATQITLRYPIMINDDEGMLLRLEASFLDVDHPENDVVFQTQALSHHGYVTTNWMIEEFESNAKNWLKKAEPEKEIRPKVITGRFNKKIPKSDPEDVPKDTVA